jgi:CubicO group peptidase (beta-lactamase class C family)
MVLSVQTMNRVDEILARTQSRGRVPSVIAAITREASIAHVTSVGDPLPDRDTQYRIGSITKSLTAAVVLGLRDEGRLELDDRLDDHLPGTGAGSLRLRALLAHAAGLQREPDGDWWERHAGTTLDRLMAGVTAEKLAFSPYHRFHYSNLAYGLLGGVIERLTGQSWWEAVSARLVEPLGMARTTYGAEEPFARGYVVHPWDGSLREEPRHDAGAMAPAGQLWSTVGDLSNWAAVLAPPVGGPAVAAPSKLASAEASVIAPGTVAEMAAPAVIGDPDGWTTGYGLGLQLWRRGERVFVGHTGSMPGYLAVVMVHRPSGTGVVAFANVYTMRGATISGLGLSILEAVLDCEPVPRAVTWRAGGPPPEDVIPLCGRWWWMGREYEARWDGARSELVIVYVRADDEADEWRFTPDGPDRWRGRSGENAGEVLSVRRDGSGNAAAIDIATSIFTRDP